MLSTTIAGILSHMNEEVKVVDAARATGGSTQGGYQPIIDYNWTWHRTRDLSWIVFDQRNPERDKGRAFGTLGEQKAAENISTWIQEIGLVNVKRDEINETWKYKDVEDIPDWKWSKVRDRSFTVVALASIGDLNKTRKIDEHWIRLRIYDKNGEEILNTTLMYKENDTSTCFPLLKSPNIRDIEWIGNKKYYIYNQTNLKVTKRRKIFGKYCWLKYADWKDPYNSWGKKLLRSTLLPNFRGFIVVDDFDHTYFMSPSRFDDVSKKTGLISILEYPRPGYSINGSIGKIIEENLSEGHDVRADIYSKWHYDRVKSYNVIGELRGRDPSNVVDIVCAHYDCWWNQGTVDEAAETALVLGIAKYMKELEEEKGIKPEHTVKFIAFDGEEMGFRGTLDYIKKYVKSGKEVVRYVVNPGNFGHNDSTCADLDKKDRDFNICVNKDCGYLASLLLTYQKR